MVTSNVAYSFSHSSFRSRTSQALLRHLVWLHVIYADLKIIEPGRIQSLDSLWRNQVAVCDDRRNRALFPYMPDEQIQIRMQRGLPSAESHDAGSERAEFVDPLQHCGSRNRRRVSIEFIAVR